MTQALRRSGLHGAGLAHIQFGPGLVAGRRLGGVGLVESADRLWLLCVAAAAIGTAEAALTAAVEYTGQRTQFGQRLSQFAALRSIMGQVRADLDASWAAVEGAAAVTGNAVAARAALTAGAAGVRSALQAIQLHGGYGYIEEFVVERYLRDAVSLRALAGGPRRLTQRSADELLRDRPAPS
jgi:alkylation response protein AidB-like acyl-CoA dehydrogenase